MENKEDLIKRVDHLIKITEMLKERYRKAVDRALFGQELDSAATLLEAVGIKFRVVRDGRTHYEGTQDFDINRANLSLDNDVVTSVRWG